MLPRETENTKENTFYSTVVGEHVQISHSIVHTFIPRSAPMLPRKTENIKAIFHAYKFILQRTVVSKHILWIVREQIL
jgi:hypothetical protein